MATAKKRTGQTRAKTSGDVSPNAAEKAPVEGGPAVPKGAAIQWRIFSHVPETIEKFRDAHPVYRLVALIILMLPFVLVATGEVLLRIR